MANKWTDEQLDAITQRGCNLLVAAAAGAGKTAVLVERIIRKITDSENPVDIDRLLVVTFTNAAATEMRERIGNALEAALEKDPASDNLQRQMALLDRSSIMTIHSFCLEVVRGHFHSLGLDPAFRIADETESTLMKLEVLDKLFEDKYENEPENSPFFKLVESYGGGRDDSSFRDIVLNLHRFTRSSPWPEQWLAAQAEAYSPCASACLSSTPWARVLLSSAAAELQGLLALLKKAAARASRAQGLEPYCGVLADDIQQLEGLLEICTRALSVHCKANDRLVNINSADSRDTEDGMGSVNSTGKVDIACGLGNANAAKSTDSADDTGSIYGVDSTDSRDVIASLGSAKDADSVGSMNNTDSADNASGADSAEKSMALDAKDADSTLFDVSDLTDNADSYCAENTHHRNSPIDWNTIHAAFAAYQPARLPRCSKDADPEAQEEVKEVRGLVKEKVKKLCEGGFNETAEEIEADFNTIYPLFSYLAALVNEFDEGFSLKKKDKGLVDFNDLEHYCLKILLKDGEPTEAAKELRQKYEEILIDEYQDSNLIQELILGTVSGNQDGIHNLFMVGDVKQSIYRFRQAKPELFLSKYASYPREKGQDSRAITLYKNFRSRAQVIDGVNFIFRQIMSETVGELDYTEKEALNPGAVFEEPEFLCQTGGPVELNIIDTTSEKAEIFPEKYGINGDSYNNDSNSKTESCNRGLSISADCKQLNDDLDSKNEACKQDLSISADCKQPNDDLNGKTEACKQFASESKDGMATHKQNISELKEDKQEIGKHKTDKLEVDSDNSDEPEEEAIDNIQTEARIVGKRILSLISHSDDGLMVYDKTSGGYKHAQYKDIVILMRATKGWADVFTDELTSMGIPAYADVGLGYFRTVEVDTMLSLLQIIDNPMQDIPMLAVLRSPICGFTADELAEIRLADRNVSIYEAMKLFTGANGNVQQKTADFLRKLWQWRSIAGFFPTDELVWQLMNETGYYSYVGVLPGGLERQANLRMLFERARQYEETSYKGLFNFINFINKLRSSGGDMGSAKILGENDNVVRIMSIHKSKGLEFPVVFVVGCGKRFNLRDLNESILLHQDLGFGPDVVDLEKRTITSSLPKYAISRKLRLETLSEEMRILYVAFTRAKEKLILTGCVADIEKACAKWCKIADTAEEKLPSYDMQQAATYLDWLGPAAARHEAALPIRMAAAPWGNISTIKNEGSQWNVRMWGKGAASFEKEAAAANENIRQWLAEVNGQDETKHSDNCGSGRVEHVSSSTEGVGNSLIQSKNCRNCSENADLCNKAINVIERDPNSSDSKTMGNYSDKTECGRNGLNSADFCNKALNVIERGPNASDSKTTGNNSDKMECGRNGPKNTDVYDDGLHKIECGSNSLDSEENIADISKYIGNSSDKVKCDSRSLDGTDICESCTSNSTICRPNSPDESAPYSSGADLSQKQRSMKAELRRRLEWQYPGRVLTAVPAKLSVSELKRRFSVENEDEAAAPFIRQLAARPAFMEKEKGISAAGKGTIMHFVMQHLDLERLRAVKNAREYETQDDESLSNEIRSQIKMMVENEQLTELEAGTVKIPGIAKFFNTHLGLRMLMVETINRETAFNIQIKCSEIYKELSGGNFDDVMLLQGVIDCWFRSDDGLVLLDYKTDYVPEGGEDSIRERYTIQLDYYTRALEKITGERVKERYLYLFYTGELISC